MKLSTTIALTAGLAFSCYHTPELIPATGVTTLPQEERSGVVSTEGVQLTVRTDAWRSRPKDLGRVLTPIAVSIENHSGHPLRIRYSDFGLEGAQGFVYAAIPPLSLQGTAYSQGETPSGQNVKPAYGGAYAAIYPRFSYRGFYVSPFMYPYYPALTPWYGPYAWDPWYYDYYYGYWPTLLPTRDMVERALPEGVLENNGRITGFLFFPSVEVEKKVTFRAKWVNAETGEPIGSAAVPFLVD